jgi:signal transduction histidine kinase
VESYTFAHRMPVVLTARAVMFLLCATLTALSAPKAGQIAAVGGLLIVAVLASLPWNERVAWWIPTAEGVLAAAVIAGSAPLNEALLPYLIVPALGAGLARGLWGALVTVVMSGLVVLGAKAPSLRTEVGLSDIAAIMQWLVVSMAVGLLAAWARNIQQRPTDPDVAAYESAYRLLNELRTVSRQLSVGLDQNTLADSMLNELMGALPADRGAAYAVSDNGKFAPLSASGIRAEVWAPRASDGSAWARALRTGRPHTQTGGLGLSRREHVYGAVVPVKVGQRTIAMIGVERDGSILVDDDLSVAASWASDYAIRLDTALLFSEVRSIATAEERRRLAREIHDGVAQELASLGYAIDDLAAQASNPQVKDGLRELRSEVTRVITELRLSIFDLRSEVTAGVSLNTALSDYIRSLGPSLDAEVHVSLQETGTRLRFETEAELLRIAQEALTNCRRHAGATNIWIRSSITPPDFEIVITDDGKGLGEGRVDSYGMEIMRERTARIGGTLDVSERAGGGTIVRVAAAVRPLEGSETGRLEALPITDTQEGV